MSFIKLINLFKTRGLLKYARYDVKTNRSDK